MARGWCRGDPRAAQGVPIARVNGLLRLEFRKPAPGRQDPEPPPLEAFAERAPGAGCDPCAAPDSGLLPAPNNGTILLEFGEFEANGVPI